MKRDPTKRMLALARQLDRRECFADSIDGLNAHVIFGMLLDEREAAQPPAVDEATAQLTPPKDAESHGGLDVEELAGELDKATHEKFNVFVPYSVFQFIAKYISHRSLAQANTKGGV